MLTGLPPPLFAGKPQSSNSCFLDPFRVFCLTRVQGIPIYSPTELHTRNNIVKYKYYMYFTRNKIVIATFNLLKTITIARYLKRAIIKPTPKTVRQFVTLQHNQQIASPFKSTHTIIKRTKTKAVKQFGDVKSNTQE